MCITSLIYKTFQSINTLDNLSFKSTKITSLNTLNTLILFWIIVFLNKAPLHYLNKKSTSILIIYPKQWVCYNKWWLSDSSKISLSSPLLQHLTFNKKITKKWDSTSKLFVTFHHFKLLKSFVNWEGILKNSLFLILSNQIWSIKIANDLLSKVVYQAFTIFNLTAKSML